MQKLLIYLSILLLIYALSAGVRYHQHQVLSGGEVILTTEDGYRWLRYANDRGEYSPVDALSGIDSALTKKPAVKPLLVRMLSWGGGSAQFGSLLTLFLSGLFVFPLGMLFWQMGLPAAGIGACVSGVLSFAYLSRTSAYQIDTDMLNIFFISLASVAVYMAGRGRAYVWAALSGLSVWTFWVWYFHPGFHLVFFALLMVALRDKGAKQMAAAGAVYIIFSCPPVFYSGFRNIFEFVFGGGGVYVSADVAELAVVGFSHTFGHIYGWWWAALLGLLLSLFMGRRVVWLGVFYALSLMVFFKGIRFGMYLAPVCGAGLGVLFDRYAEGRRLYWVLVFVLALFLCREYVRAIPPAVMERGTYEKIKMLADIEQDAVVGTSWGNGFIVQFLTGRRVFADGASMHKEGAAVYAEAMMGLDGCTSAQRLVSEVSGAPVYLLFTSDMDARLDGLITSAGLRGVKAEKGLFLTAIGESGDGSKRPLEQTLYFRMHVIKEPDIECFSRVYADRGDFVIYKVHFSPAE